MERLLRLVITILLVILEYGDTQNVGVSLYSKRYERLDIDTILASRRLVTNYVECLLNRKPCPPEGKDLKRILPEALRTKCSRCWPSQKEGAIKVITRLYYDYPDQYNALRAKWDPTGEYHRRFEEYLRDQQFNAINSNGIANDFDINGDQSQISVSSVSQNSVVPNNAVPSFTNQPRPQFQAPVRNVTPNFGGTNLTQRPIRQNSDVSTIVRDELPVFLSNRFGGGDSIAVDTSTTRTQITFAPLTTTTRPTTRATTRAPPATAPPNQFTFVNFGTGPQFQTRNPILNIFNRLTMKFTNTAEFLAGMVRNSLKRT